GPRCPDPKSRAPAPPDERRVGAKGNRAGAGRRPRPGRLSRSPITFGRSYRRHRPDAGRDRSRPWMKVFVDSNIPMYVAGRDHPNREPARRVLERARSGDIEACTSTEVLQEILYR